MRRTKTWTVSLPPDMSRLAQEVARKEHRTKSELVREALRGYLASTHRPLSVGASERVARGGELAELYRQRAATRQPSEAELRKAFRGVKQMHDRLKRLTA